MTEKKPAPKGDNQELASEQHALLRQERMAVLAQLAGGVAHQIRNPLGAINNAAAIVRRHAKDAASLQAADIIREEVTRANRIITELLDYARVRPPTRTRVPVTRLLSEVLSAAAPPPDIAVRSPDSSCRCALWGDEGQMRDAIGNLLQNAYDAMPQGGEVLLSCTMRDDDVTVSVVDTGRGIDPATLDRIFEPLVTTKPYGMGLGLTVARALVENQGGSVHCHPAEAGGTCFEVLLPRPPEAAS